MLTSSPNDVEYSGEAWKATEVYVEDDVVMVVIERPEELIPGPGVWVRLPTRLRCYSPNMLSGGDPRNALDR